MNYCKYRGFSGLCPEYSACNVISNLSIVLWGWFHYWIHLSCWYLQQGYFLPFAKLLSRRIRIAQVGSIRTQYLSCEGLLTKTVWSKQHPKSVASMNKFFSSSWTFCCMTWNVTVHFRDSRKVFRKVEHGHRGMDISRKTAYDACRREDTFHA